MKCAAWNCMWSSANLVESVVEVFPAVEEAPRFVEDVRQDEADLARSSRLNVSSCWKAA